MDAVKFIISHLSMKQEYTSKSGNRQNTAWQEKQWKTISH